MSKKILLQLFFFSIIFIMSLVFYKVYFTTKEVAVIQDKKEIIEKKSNLINNIKYIANDMSGNEYIITSKFGEFNYDQQELILMKTVIAIINFNNFTKITISSDKALYNSITNDTNFYDNVLVTYNDNTITSDNLDLKKKKNLVTISNNIIYNNLNTKLQADKVEIDLTTKDLKIFMNNNLDKVNIVSTN